MSAASGGGGLQDQTHTALQQLLGETRSRRTSTDGLRAGLGTTGGHQSTLTKAPGLLNVPPPLPQLVIQPHTPPMGSGPSTPSRLGAVTLGASARPADQAFSRSASSVSRDGRPSLGGSTDFDQLGTSGMSPSSPAADRKSPPFGCRRRSVPAAEAIDIDLQPSIRSNRQSGGAAVDIGPRSESAGGYAMARGKAPSPRQPPVPRTTSSVSRDPPAGFCPESSDDDKF